MQWIRTHISSAHVIAMIALFVALGSTSIAAVTLTKNSVGAKQIKKNAVRASEVNRNAVGASELRSNAVASGDIADNGVGAADLADNSVGAGELSDNSVGAGETAANSVGSGEVTDGSLLAGDFAANQLAPQDYARVQADGTLEPGGTPSQNKGVDPTDIQHPALGVYCFGGLDNPIANALVSMDNAGAATTTTQVVSVAIQRGANLNGCDAGHQQARVNIMDVSPALAAAAAVDGRFDIWFIY